MPEPKGVQSRGMNGWTGKVTGLPGPPVLWAYSVTTPLTFPHQAQVGVWMTNAEGITVTP